MTKLSQTTKEFIEVYQNWQYSIDKKPKTGTIHVDEIASRVATFYEKIRGIIDWRGEHLLRRMAIERMLKRRFFLGEKGEEIAEPLILELIRGGHLPNDEIEESKIKEIERLINKYIFIIQHSSSASQKRLEIQFHNWILGIAACEIEEILSPALKEKFLIEYMSKSMNERIKIREQSFAAAEKISQGNKNIQIYIAVQRALFDFDSSLITYNLLKKLFPDWTNPTKEQLININKNIYSIRESIEKQLTLPLSDKFYQICERYDTPYLILGDIVSENLFEIDKKITEPEVLESLAEKAYTKRYKTLKLKVRRAGFYATLSIFISNMLSLYIIEMSFTKWVLGYPLGEIFTPLVLAINVLAPTFLMFALIMTVKLPPRENLPQATAETIKIVYETEKKDKYEIKSYSRRNPILNALITIIYLSTFIFSYGLIIWGLRKIGFPIVSQITFVIFISLIAFAGVKIRRRAKELHIIKEKEGFFYFLLDLVSIPITLLGKWLSNKWKKYNVLALFFSALIDMPFQIFIEFLEHWRSFLKEQKEKIH